MRGSVTVAVVTAAGMLMSARPAVAMEPGGAETPAEAAMTEAEPADSTATDAVLTEPVSTEAAKPEAEPVDSTATDAVSTEPVPTEAAPLRPAPSRRARIQTEPTDGPARRPGDRMVRVGVGIVVAGLGGYVLMAAGLGIGNRAESDLVALSDREDIAARREVLARGQLGNRLAIAGAITATAALGVGIPLIAVGRRRHEASLASTRIVVGGVAAGFGLRVRGRF